MYSGKDKSFELTMGIARYGRDTKRLSSISFSHLGGNTVMGDMLMIK